jgi:excisionase family DNA binding protein
MIKWLSVPQAAARLGLNPRRVRRLIETGELPAVKAGAARNSRWRIAEHFVNAYARRSA